MTTTATRDACVGQCDARLKGADSLSRGSALRFGVCTVNSSWVSRTGQPVPNHRESICSHAAVQPTHVPDQNIPKRHVLRLQNLGGEGLPLAGDLIDQLLARLDGQLVGAGNPLLYGRGGVYV